VIFSSFFFNKDILQTCDFTQKRVSHINEALSIIGEVIEFYSTHVQDFFVIPKFQKSLFDLSNNLSKKNYKFTDKYTVVYQGKVDTLDLKMPKDTMDCFNCECSIFMKQGICKHLIGLSNSYDLNFFWQCLV
jgi:cob(I)alamin adenosyltransferase